MNRRNFLKWVGAIGAYMASPKIEGVAKEIPKAEKPPKIIQPLPCFTGCFTGGAAAILND